jgi:GT2 family glycosyltransferase
MISSVPKFLFITVVYNNHVDTERFCQSLRLQERTVEFEIRCIVVDNSSDTDISAKLASLTDSFDFVSILRPGTNTGYFGGANYALERNDCSQYVCVAICNNDLEFSRDFCKTFLALSFSEDTFVVCPNVVTLDGFHQNPHVVRPLSRLARVRLDLYFSNFYVAAFMLTIKRAMSSVLPRWFWRDKRTSSGFIHMGIGACYLLLPQFFARFAKLYYPFFLYGEEAFLSAQVHDNGGKLFYCSALNIRHKESATLSKVPARISYEYGRSGYRTYRKLY